MKKAYLLSKRGPKFYYRLADEKTFHSTGETSEAKALDFVLGKLSGRPSPTPGGRLEDFARGFFDWQTSSWIKRQHAKGRPSSEVVARTRQAHVNQYIIPQFGKRRMGEIRKPEIESWLIGLSLSNQTKNHILYTLRIILREAVDAGTLAVNPLEHVEALGHDFRPRDVFSAAELAKLFPAGDLAAVWGSQKKGCAFIVLASTGIRSGELRALTWRQFLIEGRALLIDRAVKGGSGGHDEIGTTKTGDVRIALLPSRTFNELQAWRAASRWVRPEDWIFQGARLFKPMSSSTFTHALPAAIARLGEAAKKKQLPPPIDTKGRNLVVHSFRHGFNTMMRRLVPEEALHALTGHRSTAMSERYDHPDAAALLLATEPVRSVVEQLFG